MIRVVIVDDHPIVRRGLREIMDDEADLRVVAEASAAEEVPALLAQHPCDVLLLDLSLPGRGGLEVLSDIRRASPRVHVLVVSTYAASQFAVRAIRSGAAGYLSKSSVVEELVLAVRAVMQTGRYINDEVASMLADYAHRESPVPPHELLSTREHEVLRLLYEGNSISDIATHLSLSVKSISTYRRRAFEKLGVDSTAALVRYAVEHKLFP